MMPTTSRVKVSARPIVEWPHHLLELAAHTMSYLRMRWPDQSFKEVPASHMVVAASLATRPLPTRRVTGRAPHCPREEAAAHGTCSWSSASLCMIQRCPQPASTARTRGVPAVQNMKLIEGFNWPYLQCMHGDAVFGPIPIAAVSPSYVYT
ncbi:hypothetical protein Dimus_011132 [Dionaea muscipula]